MSYCTRCGKPNRPGSSFCTSCGARLVVPAAELRSGGESSPRAQRRSLAPLWVAIGVLGLTLAVLAVVFLPRFLRGGGGDREPSEPGGPGAQQVSADPGNELGPEPGSDGQDIRAVYAAADPFEDENGCVPEDQVQAAIDAVYAAALQCPEVLSCQKDEYGVFMEVAEGPDYIYCPRLEDADAGGGGLQIITLQPFDTENRDYAEENNKNYDLDAPDTVAQALDRKEVRWHFPADINDDRVDLDRILSLSDYQVILWQGHGDYSSFSGYCICTDIVWTEELAAQYGLDKSNSCRNDTEDHLALKPAFFEQNFPDGAFDNAFIYLATCYSGKTEKMAQTLLNKGAAVVFVNSEEIGRTYNLNMLHLISEFFLIGPDGEVSSAAIREVGSDFGDIGEDRRTVRTALILAKYRYGKFDSWENGLLQPPASVYYLCRPGMETTPYAEWVAGFGSEVLPTDPPEERIFDDSTWQFIFGQTNGSVFDAVFHADGTLTAFNQNMYIHYGYYLYEDGVLTLHFPRIEGDCTFHIEGDGFVSDKKYPMQYGEDYYTIAPLAPEPDSPLNAFSGQNSIQGYVQEITDHGGCFRILETFACQYDTGYVYSLQVGDRVETDFGDALVEEIGTQNGSRAVFLDNMLRIIWSPDFGKWVLCDYSNTPLLTIRSENEYRADSWMKVWDPLYAENPGEGWTMDEIQARYGDLSRVVFRFQLVDGVISGAAVVSIS